MKSKHEWILVPRVAANDDHALLVGWVKRDGERVAKDDVICELEFSKSVVELPASRDGWLFHLRSVGDEVSVGTRLAAISSANERPAPAAHHDLSSIKVTAKARALIETHGLDIGVFEGLDIVKEKHVRALLDTREPALEEVAEGELLALTPVRRRAAQAVSESKQTIPHSHLCRWVSADRVEASVGRLARKHDMMVSVADWLVATVVHEAARNRKVNASWRSSGIFVHSKLNVGYALNQPNGELLVPVVVDADRLGLEDLVGRLRGLQKKALRHRLTPAELSGGTITVTSLVGSGVHQVFPILVPGQAAIVALGDRAALGGAATYGLTVGFDHRVLNGTEAAEFLTAVAVRLEGAEQDTP
ncbi:MAG TPA: 2-oxo acid dehydrogenase subunit E2 [Candidatus Polarisedimenticolaceae bacterium]|nr:2-oxo acid dehydrogenase subunit E2 [Candidatus Polarisedimenticolaceae bacterium]